MTARGPAAGALVAALLLGGAYPAAAQCVPDFLLAAIAQSEGVRIVQLGPDTGRVKDPFGEVPDRFMGRPRIERFEVGGKARDWLLDAFGRRGRYDCEAKSGWASTHDAATGVVGIEFETGRGPVRILLSLPDGRVEVALSGVRYAAQATVDANVAWTEFTATFAGERRRTPEEFVAAMLADQSPPAAGAPAPRKMRPRAATRADSLGPPPGLVVAPPPRRPDGNPQFGEYVYVEELPEATHRVPPEYPQAAREAGVTGTVLVQALVGKDGKVHETRIQKSIPMLDAAATAAVSRWIFKPALSKGAPVAVWVAVPVRFPPSNP